MASDVPSVPVTRPLERRLRSLYAVAGMETAALLPFFALWMSGRGLTPDRIGYVVAAGSLAGVVAAPIWSSVADERLGGGRTLVISSLGAFLAALALIPTDSNVWAIGVGVVVWGAVAAPGTALADSLALAILGPARETEFGRVRRWASVGWAGAVVVFGAWFQSRGLSSMLPLYAALMLCYAAVASGLIAGAPPVTAADPQTGGRPRRPLGAVGDAFRASPRMLPFLAGLFLVSTANAAANTFLPLRIVAKGGGPLLIGISLGIGAVIEIPFFAAAPWLGERASQRALFAAGVAIWVVMFLDWSLTGNPTAVAAIRTLGGAGFGLIYAALVVITGRLVPEHLRNTGQALMWTVSWGLAPMVGNALGGLVYVHLGASVLFLVAGVFAAAGAVVVWTALSGGESSRAGVPALEG